MVMAYLGDRLHLFKAMADCGPVSSTELAAQANVDTRYTQEWLSAMVCAGYVEYDPSSATFTLPPEHAPVLAQEAGPYFMGAFLIIDSFKRPAAERRSRMSQQVAWNPPA
jgi:hypothetical protein